MHVSTGPSLPALRSATQPALGRHGVVVFVETGVDMGADAYEHRLRRATAGSAPAAGLDGIAGVGPVFSPRADALAFRDAAGGVHVWEASRGASRCLVRDAGAGELAWSPDGGRLAFTAPSGTAAPATAPLVMTGARHRLGDPPPGAARGGLFVVDREGGAARELAVGERGVFAPAWSPDGGAIAVCASTASGESGALVAELAGGWRPLELGLEVCASLAWLPDGRFVVAGQRSSDLACHTRLWCVERPGAAPRELAEGLDRNVMVGGPGYPGATPQPAAGGREIVFAARDGGCVHLYRAPIDGGAATKAIGGEDRVVSGASVRDGTIAATVARWDSPPELLTCALDGSGAGWLTAINAATLAGFEHRPEPRSFLAPDGGRLEGWVLRPAAKGPRPLLLDIHGGPHNAFAPSFADLYLYRYALVERGWAVAFANPRGSDGYGERCFGALREGWGEADTGDQLAIVDALVADGTADPARVAVTGYSYGGYMTNWLTATTDRFAAAVTGGCISDLATCYAGSAEAQLFVDELAGGPVRRADLAARLSPIRHVQGVRAPTLVLHGSADASCGPDQARLWFAALHDLGVETELVLYPGADHLFIVNGRPSHRIDYAERVVAWLTRHVGT